MSEEQEVQTPTPEVEAQARELGWKPKTEFRGDPKNWVPATEYVKRGENVLPYIQADRRKLFQKVDAQEQEIRRLSTALSESAEAITTLKQFTTSDALKKKDQEIVTLRRELAEARRGGNVETEVEVESKLDAAKEERAALASEAREPKKVNGSGTGEDTVRVKTNQLAQTPEFQQFLRDNPWYQEDTIARAVATAISGEIMQDPENKGLSFGDKLALVAEQTKARLGIGAPTARQRSKVEGSRGSGSGNVRSSNEPSYESLSPEAKEACARLGKNVIGPNRAFKTEAEWQSHYAKMVS